MVEVRSGNPFLREVQILRQTVAETILNGVQTNLPADQIGVAYAALTARHAVLRDLEERFHELIQQGDTLEDD